MNERKKIKYSDWASNINGLFVDNSCNFLMVSVIVALNRRVCRFLGKILKIVCSWSPKLSSSKRSASSNILKNIFFSSVIFQLNLNKNISKNHFTSICILLNENSVPLSMWSAKRPGVAITTWGFSPSSLACSVISFKI